MWWREAGGEPGAAAEADRRRRGPLPTEEPAEMLAENLVEEFGTTTRTSSKISNLLLNLGRHYWMEIELEDSLQQMYTTNQEQLQEIEVIYSMGELLLRYWLSLLLYQLYST